MAAHCGRPGAGRLALARRRFLIPLDAERNWYRYHHLFAAALRQRLQRIAPEQLPELHRRAAGWLAAQGLGDAAIDHALAAGEQALAAFKPPGSCAP
jgi:LuxR family transcriptional regulator, maltose regulon positive regulatory protein